MLARNRAEMKGKMTNFFTTHFNGYIMAVVELLTHKHTHGHTCLEFLQNLFMQILCYQSVTAKKCRQTAKEHINDERKEKGY